MISISFKNPVIGGKRLSNSYFLPVWGSFSPDFFPTNPILFKTACVLATLPYRPYKKTVNFKSFAGGIGLVGVLTIGNLNAADVDYERDWNPYVTLRGGWLFGGKAKYDEHLYGADTGVPAVEHAYGNRKENLKSA